jgi:hypothetical protein
MDRQEQQEGGCNGDQQCKRFTHVRALSSCSPFRPEPEEGAKVQQQQERNLHRDRDREGDPQDGGEQDEWGQGVHALQRGSTGWIITKTKTWPAYHSPEPC